MEKETEKERRRRQKREEEERRREGRAGNSVLCSRSFTSSEGNTASCTMGCFLSAKAVEGMCSELELL